MRCEGGEDFSLLTRRHFGKVQTTPQLGCHLVELFRRNLEVTMRLLKAKRRLAGFGGVEFEWPTRYVGDPQRSLEFEAGKPFQVLGMPFPQLRVLGLLASNGVFLRRRR